MAVAPVITIPSSKHSGVSGMTTQLFTQHSAECPLRGGFAVSLTNWAMTPTASGGPWASWPSFVDPQARVRMVAWPNTAWTQGNANPYAVGLECAGYAHFTPAQWRTPEGKKQLENLAQEWAYYWRLEAEVGNKIPFRWLSTPEVRAVMAGNRKIKGFCTHAQIDPASRTDPGPNFPYKELLARIEQIVTGTSAAGEIKKDWLEMASEADVRKVVREELKEAIWDLLTYKGNLEGGKPGEKDPHDLYWYIRNPGHDVWTHPIDSRFDPPNEDGKRKQYQAASHLGVINEAANLYKRDREQEQPPAAPKEGE